MKENVHLTRNYEYVTMQELQEKTNEILQNSNIEVNINLFSVPNYVPIYFKFICSLRDMFQKCKCF